MHVFRCSTYLFVYSGDIFSPLHVFYFCEYRTYGAFLLRHVLSLQVCVFISEHVLARVSGLSCVVRSLLLVAYAGCMHLEADAYAFCFHTLLDLSLCSLGGCGGFYLC